MTSTIHSIIDFATQQYHAFDASTLEFSLAHFLGGIVLMFGFYATYVYNKWEKDFCGQRVMRTCDHSPSNKHPPEISKFEAAQAHIAEHAFDDCEFTEFATEKQSRLRRSINVIRKRARAISFMGAMSGNDTADHLDMDHVNIRYWDFLWGFCFIGPFSYILWKKGTVILAWRKWLVNKGYMTLVPADYDALVGIIVMEQSQVIHYFATTRKDKVDKLGNVAGFYFADFPYVDNECNYKVADLLAVHIDLDTKRFVKANMDHVSLNASETLILLWFNTVAAQHVKLHAMANWGINQHPSLRETNPFLLQNSTVTAIYNYFGYSTFHTFFTTWVKQGLLSDGWAGEKQPWNNCVNHGIREGIAHHSNITDLVKYSRFVNFAVKVRAIFIHEFGIHKHMFPGIDGEAFFVGTVLHSLDHTLMEWNLPDALYLNVDDPKFGKMAEIGRIVRCGFVSDVPGLYFNKRFSGSSHPFYKKVYDRAYMVDKELADNMDTCIIK